MPVAVSFSYLSAVCIFAFQFLIWVSVDVRVLPTKVSISSPADSTLGRQIETPRDETCVELQTKKKKKLSIFPPDRWWNRPSLGYTERWRHRGWSGCCRSWSPACSPSPDLQWNRTYSCRSGRSPVREQIHLFFLHSNCKSTKMARGTRVQCLNAWPRSCGTASWRCSLRCRVLGIRRCRRRPRLNKVIILRYVIFLSRGAV